MSSTREALQHDPEFGRAYSGLAASLRDVGRREEAQKYWDEALRRMDRMTEREKLRTIGNYFGMTRNYDKAIETYDELLAKYPSDSSGYNNLAVAHFYKLNFAKALEQGRKAIEIYPKTVKYRANYALYAMYAGDFQAAASTAKSLIQDQPTTGIAYLPLAMEALSAGDTTRARATYVQGAGAGGTGASLAGIGLADIAIYEGRPDQAVAALPAAIQADEKNGNTPGAAAKLLALSEAHAALGQAMPSQTAITRARALASDDGVLVTAARQAIASGRLDEAAKIAATLSGRLPAPSRAFAKMIEGEMAIARKQYPAAIDALNGALALADLWLVRFSRGLAYFHRGDYPGAMSEFQKCLERRGEATAVFLDDSPTFRYYAPRALLARARARDAEAGSAAPIRGVRPDPQRGERRPPRRRTPSAACESLGK